MIIVMLTFVVTLGIMLGAYWMFVVHPERAEHAALQERLMPDPLSVRTKQVRLVKRPDQLNAIERANKALARAGGLLAPLQRDLVQGGLKLTVPMVLLASACCAGVTYVVVRMVTFHTMLAVACSVPAASLPFIYVRHAKNKRLRQFEEQFPEAIDLIARALRAGHAFTTGLLMVAEEIPQPVGGEFKLLHDRQNFGMPLPEALRAFAARIPLIDARFFATAVLTQRETGGNLSEVLDNLASVIRDRFRVKRQVRVLTAHGRITGWILAGLPPALAAAMFVVAPDHLKMLVNDPLGVQMIVGALFLQVAGTLLIRKLVDIPY